MTIAARIRINQTTLEGGAALRVQRTFGATAGYFEVTFPSPIEVTAAPGDPTSVDIQVSDRPQRAFTGVLDSVECHGTHTVFRAMDARVHAGRVRVNRLFQEQTTDAIIRDLASEADIEVGVLGPGVPLLTYLADDGRSVLAHMNHVARVGGAHLFVDREGTLQTAAYVPTPPQVQFQYGRDVYRVAAAECTGGGQVEVRTEGAAATNGLPAAHWLTSDTGQAAGVATVADGVATRFWLPEIRTMASATTVANHLALRRAQRSRQVRLRCLGAPELELAATILLVGVPGSSPASALRIAGIEHRLNPWEGLLTDLQLEGVGN